MRDMILQGIGATVYDIGVDVPDKSFVEKAEEVGADIVYSIFLSLQWQTKDIIHMLQSLRSENMTTGITAISVSSHYSI